MPIQLSWTPNTPTPAASRPQLGLEIRGDATIGASVDGRVKLIEVQSASASGRGSSESASQRLITTFHGTFHRDASAPVQNRVTFEIFQHAGHTTSAHSSSVHGFDPECIFGADAIVLTFVNREFIIWLPFHVDSRSEGTHLEIVAVAETGAVGSATEIARSMVRNMPISRTHVVDSTSRFGSSSLTYNATEIGHQVLYHSDYIINVGVPNATSTAAAINLDPGFMAIASNGSAVPFSAYQSGALRIILLTDLLDDVVPEDSFLTGNITGVTAATLPALRTSVQTHFRNTIKTTVEDMFTDAGFTGATALWQNDSAATTLVSAFNSDFIRNTFGGHFWRLQNSSSPMQTSFWNFFVGSSDQIQSAGVAEQLHNNALTQRTISSQSVYIKFAVPIGSGNKSLETPIQIASERFKDLITDRSGLPRTYATLVEFLDAVDKSANKMAILIAHEVAHSLGLMHHCRISSSGNYSESNGAPILSIMSSDVESGGFGTGLKFHSQAKVIWEQAFGVTPTYNDQIFQNKTWTASQVTTMDWGDRTSRFLRAHGEGSIARPHLSSVPITASTPPVFAQTPPNVQRGTYVPPPPSSTP